MPIERTLTPEGVIVSEHHKPQTITLSFEKKVGKPNYGNEAFSLFAQVDVDPSDDLAIIEAKLNDMAAFCKGYVYKQLGLTFGRDEASGVIVSLDDEVPAAPAPKPARATAAPSGGDKEALWRELDENPSKFFDNRQGKTNPKAPDFKRKGTGEPLWLNNAPAWMKDKLVLVAS
jgi:hypothetical protein